MATSSAPATPPLPYTPAYPIRTERLDLRPVTDDDFAAIAGGAAAVTGAVQQ
ncbi:hypothetical protein SLV14_003287 [Streptomyces sp. Je 1-4]|uniref:hypothetical protein n=1 Tax=Streptomyces TaxID=1883 RepID=UPI002180AF15|nr:MULTISPECIES: hypothetical protein [unclassified Streptomyces]UYB40638.1 hypothetical protein SLV14_003287 [Streptomyces sp. Je 1-4]UZQ36774.1 hypothetical protein SLV14N_003287 [Streptomyces sp. Je 1-4] [Streptomyces sp. Je 1-4 4N24]UZQ44191.1 hypothetical protein SLV14NA_003287 [Streptomyces sp. Je 1-4] [Streptomyces sp. Je 1-4 4N24_ara]